MARKPSKERHFVRQPHITGGNKAIDEIIKEQLRYPELALQSGIEGTVHVRYDITDEGRVMNALITKGLGFGLDEEAVRLVSLLRFQTNKARGYKITHHRDIQIHFKLPVQQQEPVPAPAPPTSQLVYHIVEEKPKQPTSHTNSYTIRYN